MFLRKVAGLVLAVALILGISVLAGCTAAVDKSEVQQRANPVKEMHREIAKAQALEKNRPEWYSYEDALVKARQEGKFVMVDFYAAWCKWCKQLDSDTYTDPKVVEALKAGFVPVKIDAEAGKPVVHEMRQMTMNELAESYEVKSYPSIWFLDKDGKKAKLLSGYLPPDSFLVYLQYIKSGRYKDMEFEDYVKKGLY